MVRSSRRGKAAWALAAFAFGLFLPCRGVDEAALAKAKEVLAGLTLDQKVRLCAGSGTMTLPAFEGTQIDREWQFTLSSRTIKPDVDRWSFNCVGTNETDAAIVLPSLGALAATWNTELAAEYGHVMGEQARSRGKDMVLGPAVNIMRNPLAGRNWETFGEDPHLASKMAVAWIRALQSHDVAACVKHFCLNSQELGKYENEPVVDERALNEIYLAPFRAAVKDGGVWGVMTAHNRFQRLACSENPYLLRGILRARWGFEGMVVSGWGAVGSTVEAALAGTDVEMNTGADIRHYVNPKTGEAPLASAVAELSVPPSCIEDKARRILYTMARTKFFSPDKRAKGERLTEKHRKTALQVAEEGIVLLKNANAVLPLDAKGMKKILVIGDLAASEEIREGAESPEGKPFYQSTPQTGLVEYFSVRDAEIVRASFDSLPTPEEAATADAVLVFTGFELGHEPGKEGSGNDRADMRLPAGTDEAVSEVLSWQHPRTVVVNRSGGPVELPWIEECPALVQIPYLGQEAGRALVNVLFGETTPSGKLPWTWPKRFADTPVAAEGAYGAERSTYREGIYVGYRWYDKEKIPPLFPFAHGLSYTKFEYDVDKAAVATLADGAGWTVSVPVKNIGDRPGKETVQIYAAYPNSRVTRCVKDLKGFAKTKLLAPGESETLTVSISPRNLAYWDSFASAFRLDAGEYELRIGSSALDLRGKAKITVPRDYVFKD